MSETQSRQDSGQDSIDQRTFSTGNDLVVAILDAIADAAGLDAAELNTPLYDVIDPDALAKLFHTLDGSVDGYVAFTYEGYRIVAYSDGTVQVYDEESDE